jgi:tetratricopeptide (TPR) repeat protein
MKTVLLFGLVLLTAGFAQAIEAEPRSDIQGDVNTLLDRADSLFDVRSHDSAMTLYSKAAEIGEKQGNPAVRVEALAQMARVSLIQGHTDKGRVLLGQAEAYGSESEPLGWSRYLSVRGRFEWQAGDLIAASGTFEEMFRYCDVNGLWDRAVDAAQMMAIVSETPQEQIQWGKQGIELAEDYEVTSRLGPLWNNLAATYYDAELHDSALTAYLQAREYHWRYSGESGKLWADYSVGMTYRKLQEYDKAASWLRPVLAWAERLGDHGAMGQASEDLGEIALAQGDREAGMRLLRRARDEYQAAGYDNSWPEVWEHINQRLAELR